VDLQTIRPEWNCPVVVAATGPSLTADVAAKVRRARWPEQRCRVVAVNDAYRLLPYADILYACDAKWWRLHIDSVRELFHGERWTTHDPNSTNDKTGCADELRLTCVAGRHEGGFSRNPAVIHYGSNSGFQAINLALLKGATRVILVGFDMGGRGHFFGDHPEPLHNRDNYAAFLPEFRTAARSCAVPIVNATPGSALDCWPIVRLEEALGDDLLHRDRPERDCRAGAVGA
jgi:hypothetical protein